MTATPNPLAVTKFTCGDGGGELPTVVVAVGGTITTLPLIGDGDLSGAAGVAGRGVDSEELAGTTMEGEATGVWRGIGSSVTTRAAGSAGTEVGVSLRGTTGAAATVGAGGSPGATSRPRS